MIKRILKWIVGFLLCICSAVLMIVNAGRLFLFGLCVCIVGVCFVLSSVWDINE